MKKIFALAATALFIMTSCSSDDAQPTNPGTNNALLKKTVETFEDGSTFTTNYNYNGNKIVSVTDSEGNIVNFTYTGDLITEVKYYEGQTLFQRDVLEYDNNGKLTTSTMYLLTQNSASKGVYTHNSNGTITINNFYGDLESQTEPSGVDVLTVVNNNITNMTGGLTASWTFTNTIDPLSNITGYMGWMLANGEGGVNNLASYNYQFSEGPAEIGTITYTYNSNNYPATSIDTNTEGDVITTQFFYE